MAEAQPHPSPDLDPRETTPSMFTTATEGDSDYEGGDDDSVHSHEIHLHHHHHHHHRQPRSSYRARQPQSQRNVQLDVPLCSTSAVGAENGAAPHETGRLLEPCPEPVSLGFNYYTWYDLFFLFSFPLSHTSLSLSLLSFCLFSAFLYVFLYHLIRTFLHIYFQLWG